MKEEEKKAILANVKRVEKEELRRIAERLKEWEDAGKKRDKSTDLATTRTNKTKSEEREKEDGKKKRKVEGESESTDKKKGEKSSKRTKADSTTASKTQNESTKTSINPKWQEAAVVLEGDSARKSKFMRLMGAGNVSVPAANSTTEKPGKLRGELKKREEELGKQFDHGLKMKNEVGAKRKGLGA